VSLASGGRELNPEANPISSTLRVPGTSAVPYDSALPGCPLLSQDRLRDDVLSRLLASWLGPHNKLLKSSVALCRYVPGKRCNFRIELVISTAPGEIERRLVVGKIYAEEQGQKVYQVLQDLRGHGFAEGRFLVSEPLAYDPSRKLLVLTWAEGELLRALILGNSDVSQKVQEAADWLLKLHKSGRIAGRRLSFRRHLETLALQAHAIAKVYPEMGGLVGNVLQRIEACGEAFSGWTPGPTHHDFSPDHLVFHNRHLTALDFDEFRQYDPMFDVAHFMAHLRLLGLRYFDDFGRFDKLADIFQMAYRAGVRDYSEARVQFYQAVAYLKLAHIVAVVLRPRVRKEAVEMFLLDAERKLRSDP
jgi:thiamine kinase-like enzyme